MNLRYYAYSATIFLYILIKTAVYPYCKRALRRSSLLSALYRAVRVVTNAVPYKKPITPSTGPPALRYSGILISVLPSSLYRL